MSTENLNPILNPDCECPTPTPDTPTACPTPDTVTIPIDVLPETCPSCDEIIVPPLPAIADIALTEKCLTPDTQYQYIPAQDCVPGVGNAHYFYELHPACARPMQQCEFCQENNLCPEDVGLVYRKGGGNIYSVLVPAATGGTQVLLFWVHDGDRDRVLSEIGYVKVGQADNMNEWMPRDCVKKNYVLAPSAHFPGGLLPFLNETPHVGTIPTVVTETPVTSTVCD